MEKILILGSDESSNLIAIVEYFKNKNIQLICISNNQNSDFYIQANRLDTKVLYLKHEELIEYIKKEQFKLGIILDYSETIPKDAIQNTKFITVHHSILPAFDCKNEIEKAFHSGVKVSGTTIMYLKDKKIITQYPVFIDLLTTFDEFKQEIYKVENKILPFVVESIINNTIFSFDTLWNQNSCKGNCNSCHDCNNK